MQHQHATCKMPCTMCAHTGAQRRCSDTCCRMSRSASTVSGLPSRPTRSALSVRRCECSSTPTPVRLRPPSLSGAFALCQAAHPRATRQAISAQNAAAGIGNICGGTRPHMRRDSATSAAGLGRICTCAGTDSAGKETCECDCAKLSAEQQSSACVRAARTLYVPRMLN